MADEALEAPQEEKKGGKLKWVIIIILVLLLAGGGGAAYMFKDKLLGGDDKKADETTEQVEGEDVMEGEPVNTELVSLPTFLVNLADPLGRRYLKLTLEVEMRDIESAEKLNQSLPKVRDAVILLLSSKTFADLSSYDNKLALKDQIVKRLNQIVGGSRVLRVYITEMVVQ